jgi:hypothetical protein
MTLRTKWSCLHSVHINHGDQELGFEHISNLTYAHCAQYKITAALLWIYVNFIKISTNICPLSIDKSIKSDKTDVVWAHLNMAAMTMFRSQFISDEIETCVFFSISRGCDSRQQWRTHALKFDESCARSSSLHALLFAFDRVSTSFHLWNWRDVIFRRWKGC